MDLTHGQRRRKDERRVEGWREKGGGQSESLNAGASYLPALDGRRNELDVAWPREDDDDELVSSDDGKELPRRVRHELQDGEVKRRGDQSLREFACIQGDQFERSERHGAR
jgi:hypothetical protein